jgi:antitoxin (DNA-binding transcriptional repressor) of toxin-antitoxin stability system
MINRSESMMNTVTANELKTRGVSAVEDCLKHGEEAIISVRGRDLYVVIDIEKYAKLREYELAAALQEAKADVDSGRYTIESVADHMKRMTDGV